MKVSEVKTDFYKRGILAGQLMTMISFDATRGIGIELPTLVDRVKIDKTPYVLFTGDEPYKQPDVAVKNLAELCKIAGKKVVLESTGFMYTDYSVYDWVIISPEESPDDCPGLSNANEVRADVEWFRKHVVNNDEGPPWDYTDEQTWYLLPTKIGGFTYLVSLEDSKIFCGKHPRWRLLI